MSIQISAIICTCNRADYLKKAIQSLVNQTLPKERYEIIVVDNSSTDNTKAIVESFEYLRNLRYIYEPIIGLSQARNTGWQNAQGKYVTFLDDDAIASPEWLEKIVKVFETVHPQPASVGGKIIPIWEVERPAWVPKQLELSLGIIDWADKPAFLTENYQFLAGSNVAYPQEVLKKVGGFNTSLGRKGTNLLSSEEVLVKKYLKRHSLEIYYDPEICVQHHILAERLVKCWFYRRYFWQGISNEILQYLKNDQNGSKRYYLYRAIANTLRVLRCPKNLVLILMPTDSSNRVVEKCSLYSRLGQICAELQIGFGLTTNS